jgi:AraC-like DNA-binding protein
MHDAAILEVLARGAAVGAFIGLAIVIGRGGVSPARLTGILFSVAVAAHILTQSPAIEPSTLGWMWLPVWTFSAMGAGLFWAFATELFEDRARLDPRRFAPAAGLLVIAIIGATAPPEVSRLAWLAHNLVGAALIAHVLVVIASGWKGDLVEPRRRLRGPILAAGAIYALALMAVQSAELFLGSAEYLSPLAAFSLLVLGFLSLSAFLSADAELFGSSRAEAADVAAEPRALSGDGTRLAAQLERLMGEARAYREEGLTIAALALRLRTPEHRLRRLINQDLGHRNFNAFLNQWRLRDAKEALADPAQRDVPISTIALDAGFQSLGPFNRAFKAETGLTPSEFRARAMAGPLRGAANEQPSTP